MSVHHAKAEKVLEFDVGVASKMPKRKDMIDNPSHELFVSPFGFVRDHLRRGTVHDRMPVEGLEPGFRVDTSLAPKPLWETQERRLARFLEAASKVGVPMVSLDSDTIFGEASLDSDASSEMSVGDSSLSSSHRSREEIQWGASGSNSSTSDEAQHRCFGMGDRVRRSAKLRALYFLSWCAIGIIGGGVASFRRRNPECTIAVLGGVDCIHPCELTLNAFNVVSVVLMLVLCVVSYVLLETLLHAQRSDWQSLKEFFELEKISLTLLSRVYTSCDLNEKNKRRKSRFDSEDTMRRRGLHSFLTRGRLLEVWCEDIKNFRLKAIMCGSIDSGPGGGTQESWARTVFAEYEVVRYKLAGKGTAERCLNVKEAQSGWKVFNGSSHLQNYKLASMLAQRMSAFSGDAVYMAGVSLQPVLDLRLRK